MALPLTYESFEYERQILSKEEELTTSNLISPSLETQARKLTFDKEDILDSVPKVDQVPYSLEDPLQELQLGFKSSPKPWLPHKLLKQIEKMIKTPLKRKEMVDLIDEVARISAEFYQIKPGKFIAVKFDGRIVESTDTEIDLLLKIQGKHFDMPVFVWQVGSESFSGWRT